MTDQFRHAALAAAQSSGTLMRQLENLPPGSHVCPLFGNQADKQRLLVPYFEAGIVQGEQCLYIADQANVADLRAHGIGSGEDLAKGVLLTVSARESYLRNGRFDPDKMLEFWTERLDAARAAGFVGLRVTGEMVWALGPDIDSDGLIKYEARLNRFLYSTGIRAMCLYDWRRSKASVLQDVLRTHPLAIIDLRLHDNPFYEPPNLVLGEGDVERARLDWMVTQLQSVTRRDTALVDLGHLAIDSALDGALPDLMRAAQVLVTTELRLQYVQVFELMPSGDAVRLVGTTGPDHAAIGTVEWLTPDNPLASESLGIAEPVIISDWGQQTRFKLPAALQEAGITSSISIAIGVRAGAPLYGMLTVHSQQGRIFSDDECLFLEAVGIFLAYAIAAARSAASFRALAENAPDIIARFNADLHLSYVNPTIERTIGRAAQSLVGKTSLELGILEPQLPTWELTLRQVWRTGREQEFELRLGTLRGERVFDSRIVPEIGPGGEVQSLLAISRDITAQRTAEAERSELYRQLVLQQNEVQELLARLTQDHERGRRGSAATSLLNLSQRERHILVLVAAGRTNREIGADIGISPGTAKNQVAQILAKLGVKDRTQAAVRAVELGIVESAKE